MSCEMKLINNTNEMIKLKKERKINNEKKLQLIMEREIIKAKLDILKDIAKIYTRI